MGGALARGAFAEGVLATHPALPDATPAKLPRWRGFNLLEKFNAQWSGPFKEKDFSLIAGWGFDFVRLPLSYLCWTDPSDWLKLREPALKEIDQAVEYGRQHGVHVNINFHRAPGYCVNSPKEPLDLFKDEKALDACAFHWAHFARRYKGIPNSHVSFDLLNEPADLKAEEYVRVVKRLVEAIHGEDPQRLIIADGLKWGNAPVPQLAGAGVAQSIHCYEPMQVSHFGASWIQGSDQWQMPTWPMTAVRKNKEGKEYTERWDKARLHHDVVEPWKKLQAQGVGLHVGEWGNHNRTPHDVTLAWMKDALDLWREAGWGWALWNFRGSFGVADSGRKDVQYENYQGLKLDRAMLELLQAG